MATLIFVDKENGEPGTRVAPKDRLKQGSGSCKYTGCSQIHTQVLSVMDMAWSLGRHVMYLVSNWSQVYRLQAYLLYCASEMLNFLQIKGKTLHQQKSYDSLYCSTLLLWSATDPAVSLRYTCTLIVTCFM